MGKWPIKEFAWLMMAIRSGIHPWYFEEFFKVYPRIEDWYEDGGMDMKRCRGLEPRNRKKFIITAEWKEEALKLTEDMEKKDVKFVSREHEQYPQRLIPLYDWPKGLFYRGSLPQEGKPAAAIVGARNCSYYGKAAAEKLASVLAEAGVNIISGLAFGIDVHAHQGALRGKGDTYAVMGAGPEESYPKEHYYIYEEIQKHGGILSEQPPGTPVRSYLFPIRNRIISALSDCVVVVEAREKSGSLITADQALEQGKDVFALPGRMFDDLSTGCNRLIQSGAQIITGPEDLLEYFHLNKKERVETETNDPILKHLSEEPVYIQELLEKTGRPLVEISSILLTLELAGLIGQPYPNYYVKEY